MKLFSVLVASFLTISCASNTIGGGDSRTEYALAVVEDNILTTDYSALVEITRVRTEEVGIDPEKDGETLMAVIYTAKVLHIYQGESTGQIEYIQYTKRSEGPEGLSRGAQIVSLCRDRDGSLYLPDIGYELPAEQPLLDRAESVRAQLEARRLSLRRGADYACCPHTAGACP